MFVGKVTGVLIHGFHFYEPNWLEVAWFGKDGRLGKLPQGAKTILMTEPRVVVFGTAAREKGGEIAIGLMREYLLSHFSELVNLPDFKGVDLDELRESISRISQHQISAKNTYEEIEQASRIFAAAGVEVIILVSAPDHILRCSRDASKIYSENKELSCFLGNFMTFPSQVPQSNGRWPLIIESAHRLYPFVQETMSLPREKQEELIKKALGL